MTGDDVVILVNDARVDESKFPKAGAQLLDLLLAVNTGIAGIWDQSVNADFLKTLGGVHRFPFLPESRASMYSRTLLAAQRSSRILYTPPS